MIYTYECTACRRTQEKVRRVANRRDPVDCDCGAPAKLKITPVAVNTAGCTFDSFQAHGIAGRPVITSERQRKEMMARHELLDARDVIEPPTVEEEAAQRAEAAASIKAIEKMDGMNIPDIV